MQAHSFRYRSTSLPLRPSDGAHLPCRLAGLRAITASRRSYRPGYTQFQHTLVLRYKSNLRLPCPSPLSLITQFETWLTWTQPLRVRADAAPVHAALLLRDDARSRVQT